MPTPGSTKLRLDELLTADRLDLKRTFKRVLLEDLAVPPGYADTRVTVTKTRSVGISEKLTPEALKASLDAIGLVSPRPGMVLGATVTAHPLAFAVLGRALQEARGMGLEIEDWKLLQILSASLTHLDARLGTRPSSGPSEAAA